MKIGITKRSGFRPTPTTTNTSGGLAFNVNDATQRLLHIVGAPGFNEPSNYYSKPDGLKPSLARQFAINGSLDSLTGPAKNIVDTALEVAMYANPRDVLAIAHWLRKEGHCRQTPLILLACAAATEEGRKLVREYAPRIIRRADELAGAYAAYRFLFGKPIPRALLNGIKDSWKNFDEYQLIKYAGEGNNPSLKDVLLQMPDRSAGNPVSRGMAEFILNGSVVDKNGVDHSDTAPLASAYLRFLKRAKEVGKFTPEMAQLADDARATWEVVISLFGSNKQTWESVLPRMGYMAVLRNLRNLVQNGIDPTLLAGLIGDRDAVLKSKQFPFRFLAASKEIEQADIPIREKNILLDAISQALEVSVENIGSIPGDTIVIVDVSGSMQMAKISSHSSMSVKEAAACMAAIFVKACQNAYVYVFANQVELLPIRKVDSVHSIMQKILTTNVGGATFAYKPIYDAIAKGIRADRMVLLSDLQCYQEHASPYSTNILGRGANDETVATGLTEYRNKLNHNVWLHSVNLNAVDVTSQVPSGQRVNLASGFSDKILASFIEAEGGTEIPTLEYIRMNF
jgi:60 kDa SS-A/Ro ribonucleoprotein